MTRLYVLLALALLLPVPAVRALTVAGYTPSNTVVYKTVGKERLSLDIFTPAGCS